MQSFHDLDLRAHLGADLCLSALGVLPPAIPLLQGVPQIEVVPELGCLCAAPRSAASPPELELVPAAPSPHGVRSGYDEAAIPNGGLGARAQGSPRRGPPLGITVASYPGRALGGAGRKGAAGASSIPGAKAAVRRAAHKQPNSGTISERDAPQRGGMAGGNTPWAERQRSAPR